MVERKGWPTEGVAEERGWLNRKDSLGDRMAEQKGWPKRKVG